MKKLILLGILLTMLLANGCSTLKTSSKDHKKEVKYTDIGTRVEYNNDKIVSVIIYSIFQINPCLGDIRISTFKNGYWQNERILSRFDDIDFRYPYSYNLKLSGVEILDINIFVLSSKIYVKVIRDDGYLEEYEF